MPNNAIRTEYTSEEAATEALSALIKLLTSETDPEITIRAANSILAFVEGKA